MENFIYPDSLLHGNGNWSGTGVLADNFRVQSHVVNQTATQYTGTQNNAVTIPTDWTLPWSITFTVAITPNTDDGVSLIFATGTIAGGNFNSITMDFAAGDLAANRCDTISWSTTGGSDSATDVTWTPGAHTVGITWDGAIVTISIDGVTSFTSAVAPVSDAQAITWAVNNLTHTPMPQLSQITIAH